jgi:hypothetical protein
MATRASIDCKILYRAIEHCLLRSTSSHNEYRDQTRLPPFPWNAPFTSCPIPNRLRVVVTENPAFQAEDFRETETGGAEEIEMTLQEFMELRTLQDRRVQMTFTDGQVVVATLINVTSDLVGSRHLVYDKVEWSALPHPGNGKGASYAAGEQLLTCTPCSPMRQ